MNFSFPTKWRAGRRASAHPSVGHGVGARRTVLHCLVAAFVAVSFFLLHFGNCEAQSTTEYQVKAAYLFNFIRFVEWPDAPPADTPSKWTIGVVGNSPVSDELSKLVESKSILGRELQVKTFQATGNLRACNILFISESEKKRLPAILAGLRGSSVMTVADMEHFIDEGGMVQFVVEDARVRISIDVGATGRARLKVSSKLLALALAVTADRSAKN
jgi:YfiR/HmsC-like